MAAFLAGLAVGLWKDENELKSIWEENKTFSPQDNPHTERILSLWNKRIPKVLKKNE